jgi:hypothetical protein
MKNRYKKLQNDDNRYYNKTTDYDDECINMAHHIENCEECKRYYKGSSLVDLFIKMPQLKETIVVFLIGILIILILNMYYKDT